LLRVVVVQEERNPKRLRRGHLKPARHYTGAIRREECGVVRDLVRADLLKIPHIEAFVPMVYEQLDEDDPTELLDNAPPRLFRVGELKTAVLQLERTLDHPRINLQRVRPEQASRGEALSWRNPDLPDHLGAFYAVPAMSHATVGCGV
jgi:hypothetical protein